MTLLRRIEAAQSGAWTVNAVVTGGSISGITGSITITDGGGSITVDGAVSILGSVAVTGTFWQTTQPVSIAILPLPAGAATSANQTTANTSLASIDSKTPALVSGRQPVDGSGVTQPISVSTLPLPAGAATASNQSTANASLSSIDGKMPALVAGRQPVDGSGVTQPVSAASLPLPSGASTSANQATANTSLASIDSKTPALVSGRQPVDGSGVTQPVSAASLPLPTGASTAANQTTANTSLASIDGKLPSLGQKAMAASLPVVVASDQTTMPVKLGWTTGKTPVEVTNSLHTSATAADQVILTYTVTAGKTLYLQGYKVSAKRTTLLLNTVTELGDFSLEIVAGQKKNTYHLTTITDITSDGQMYLEPRPIAAATIVRLVCTPGVATALTWYGNLWGYEV